MNHTHPNNQHVDPAALGAAGLAAVIAEVLPKGPYDWMSIVFGITLLAIVVGDQGGVYRTKLQSFAFAGVCGLCMIMIAGFCWQKVTGPSATELVKHEKNLARQVQEFRPVPPGNDELNDALTNLLEDSRENGKETSRVTSTGNAAFWAISTAIFWVADMRRHSRVTGLREDKKAGDARQGA